MSDTLYRKELLRLAADAHGAGRLACPVATGAAHNPTCGDKVLVDLVVDDGHIVEMAQETRACVLTQASASLLASRLKGATRIDVERLRREVEAMLRLGTGSPAKPFEEFGAFEAATAYPSRHTCVLLPIDAVLAALDALEAPQPDTMGSER